jgi:ubiquinone/menaquinone biosynthesis C-methylase UbiE
MTSKDTPTADFYAANRYPGPDAIISRKWANRLKPYVSSEDFMFLDAGCGTGQYTAGMLMEFPASRCKAIDISETSLRDAQQILRREGVADRAEFKSQSFSEPLGWDEQFDIAIANGSIHHSPDPTQSLVNIARALKPGGVLGCMVYGSRSHARRYEVKEALQLLGGSDIDELYGLYCAYKKKLSIMDRPPRSMIRDAKNWLGRRMARLAGKEQNWSYEMPADHKRNFVDEYATPIDVAFSSRDLKQMLNTAGLDLCEMFTMGRPDESILPPTWVDPWRRLDEWDRIRVCELVTPYPMSFSFAARKTA